MGDRQDNHDAYQPATELEVELALAKAAMVSAQYGAAMGHVNSAVAAAPAASLERWLQDRSNRPNAA